MASVSLGGGRRRHFYGQSQAEVIAKRDEALRALKNGGTLPAALVTVGGVAEEWLTSIQKSVRPRTWESYSGLWRKHLKPELGGIRLSQLQPSDLERAYAKRLAAGVAPKTVRNSAGVMYGILNRCVRTGLVGRNVAPLASLPRVNRRDMRILTPDEARQLLEAAKGKPLEAFFVVSLMTGARLGELAGLQWQRVDFTTQTLRLSYSLQERGETFALVEPKTARSVRQVALPPVAVEALRRHRLAQNERALQLGAAWQNTLDLVFTGPSGAPLKRRRILRQEFRPMLREAGLPDTLRVHDLRHCAASLLLSRGVPIPVVSALLGHTDPSITLRVYSHVMPTDNRLAADAFQALFAPAL